MNTNLSRRAFVRQLLVVGTALAVPAAAHAQDAKTETKYVPVGKVTDFPAGAVKSVTLPGGKTTYVRRVDANGTAFLALSSVCTHKGCKVDWNGDDKQFVCPCHRGKFDANGVNVGGPPPRPLDKFACKVEKDTVLVGV